MVPISAEMLAPTLPESDRPVSTGPSSRIMVLPTRVPTKYMGMAPVNVYDAWSASTMPVKVAMKRAMGTEATPTATNWGIRLGPQISTFFRARVAPAAR